MTISIVTFICIHTKINKIMFFKKAIFAVLVVLLVLTSCDKSTRLTDSIPSDANYIVYINSKSIIDKSQYNIFSNPTVEKGISLYKMMLGRDRVQLLDSLMNNSNSLGVNLKGDIYLFSDYKIYGLLLAVNDKDKLSETLVNLLSIKDDEVIKDGSVNLISLDSDFCVAWNKKKLILLKDIRSTYNDMGPNDIDIKRKAKELLTQKAENSINVKEPFLQFMEAKKDISAFMTMEGFNELQNIDAYLPYQGLFSFSSVKNLLPEEKGAYLGLFTSFEEGNVSFSSNYYFDIPETERKFKHKLNSMSGTLKGDHLKYLSTDPIMLFALNLNGKGVYDYLKEMNLMDKLADESSDLFTVDELSTLIKGCDGDLTLAFTSLETDTSDISSESEIVMSYNPKCFFMIDIKDPKDVITLISQKEKESGLMFRHLGEGKYSIKIDSKITLFFGVHQNTFYVTNDKLIYESIDNTPENNAVSGKYANLIKGKSVIFAGDLSFAKQIENVSPAGMLSVFSNYEFTVDVKTFDSTGKIETVDKTQNSLAAICKIIDDAISEFGSQFF